MVLGNITLHIASQLAEVSVFSQPPWYEWAGHGILDDLLAEYFISALIQIAPNDRCFQDD
jgi:hypothetical protein